MSYPLLPDDDVTKFADGNFERHLEEIIKIATEYVV